MQIAAIILFALGWTSLILAGLTLIWIIALVALDIWRFRGPAAAILHFLLWPSLIVYAIGNRHRPGIRRCRILVRWFLITGSVGILFAVVSFWFIEATAHGEVLMPMMGA